MECPECGGRLAYRAEYADTGVRGPNGEPEIGWQEWYECLACGWTEEAGGERVFEVPTPR